jgi:hypothetical protein
MRIMCSITQATDKHTEYVTRIDLPLQTIVTLTSVSIKFVPKLSVLPSNRNETRSIGF